MCMLWAPDAEPRSRHTHDRGPLLGRHCATQSPPGSLEGCASVDSSPSPTGVNIFIGRSVDLPCAGRRCARLGVCVGVFWFPSWERRRVGGGRSGGERERERRSMRER